MKVTSELDNDHARVKLEIDESAGELDVAREKFESALQDLLFREEISDSDSEEQQQQPQQQKQQIITLQAVSQQQLITPPSGAGTLTTSSRPPRKRRRKDAESTQSGSAAAQQSSFVVRMFDRSVDLAHFTSDSPLYPICRAWLLNEPHHASGGSELNLSPPSPTLMSPGVDMPEVHFLPTPAPWNNEVQEGPSPLLPRPITPPPLVRSEGAVGPVSGDELLGHHVKHWRNVRQSWKKRAALADARYEDSAEILKEMFRSHAAAAADSASSQFA